MSAIPRLAAFITPLLTVVAISGLFITGRKNGLFPVLEAALVRDPTIPKDADTLQTFQILAKHHVSNYFTLMAAFFVPIMNLPQNLSLFVQANHFLGQLMSSWMLIYLESYRKGPFDLAKAGAIVIGLMGEFIGVGICFPIFFFLNGIGSYGWLSGGTPASAESALLPARDLAVLPWSVVIGGVIPAVLMLFFPVMPTHGFYALQTWVLIRLFHPIWSAVVQVVLKQFTSKSGKDEIPRAQKNLQRYYRAAYLMGAIPHWLTILGLAYAKSFPDTLPSTTVKALHFSNVWPLGSPFDQNPEKIRSLAEGIQTFLLWDFLMSAGATVVWAVAVHVGTLGNKASPVATIIRTAVISVFAGPVAAAVTLIRQKDEVLVRTGAVPKVKN